MKKILWGTLCLLTVQQAYALSSFNDFFVSKVEQQKINYADIWSTKEKLETVIHNELNKAFPDPLPSDHERKREVRALFYETLRNLALTALNEGITAIAKKPNMEGNNFNSRKAIEIGILIDELQALFEKETRSRLDKIPSLNRNERKFVKSTNAELASKIMSTELHVLLVDLLSNTGSFARMRKVFSVETIEDHFSNQKTIAEIDWYIDGFWRYLELMEKISSNDRKLYFKFSYDDVQIKAMIENIVVIKEKILSDIF